LYNRPHNIISLPESYRPAILSECSGFYKLKREGGDCHAFWFSGPGVVLIAVSVVFGIICNIGKKRNIVNVKYQVGVTMTVEEAIRKAELILPGKPAPDGEEDPRWQAIGEIEFFVESEPEAIWPFICKWGQHENEDLRTAIATCLLEHLLEFHFDEYFPKVEVEVKKNKFFADTFSRCWKFGQSEKRENSENFDKLKKSIESNQASK
jgi:hypothetical protein